MSGSDDDFWRRLVIHRCHFCPTSVAHDPRVEGSNPPADWGVFQVGRLRLAYCAACVVRHSVANDAIVEMVGGADVRDEYISRLESALMAAEWDKALARRPHPQWAEWRRAMRAHPDWFVARALHDANRGDLVSVEIEAVPARAADYSTD